MTIRHFFPVAFLLGWVGLAGAVLFCFAMTGRAALDTAGDTVGSLVYAAGPSGLTALSSAGTNLLASGDFTLDDATLTRRDGTQTPASRRILAQEFDTKRQEIKRTYDWGTQTCAYHRQGNRLEIIVRTQNTTDSSLSRIHLTLLTLKFPQAPAGWVHDAPYLGQNRGDPTVEYANYGTGALAVCNDDIEKPLLVGFPGRASLTERPVCVTTDSNGYLSPYLDPYLTRTIAPHGTDEFRISLRFGPPNTKASDLAADLYRKLAKASPALLHWKDRRAIGSLHIAVTEPQYHSATNPRGWFGDTKVDVVTSAGIAAFHERVLKSADDSIAVLKKMNAQGMVLWDLEGEEYPQPTTYLGEPRLLASLAPEMDRIADAYFRKFRAAGLRTGLCIRPQKLFHTLAKTEQQELDSNASITQNLYDKMVYANHRWGCTLFYVDSNGDPNVPYDPAVFELLARKLAAVHIDALAMPEHRNLRYYASTAPYAELRGGTRGAPAVARLTYPDAFLVNYVPDGDFAASEAALTDAVRQGDVLMFRGWFDDPQNTIVTNIYHRIRER